MASSVVLKKAFASNLLFSKLAVPLCPGLTTDAVGRLSQVNKRMYSRSVYSEVPLTTQVTVPRSFKREDPERVYLFVDMPGITKENVKATVKRCEYESDLIQLIINAESVKDYECECRNYSSSFDLPHNIKKRGIKADMKAGVLKVTLPKLKEINRDDKIGHQAFRVQVD